MSTETADADTSDRREHIRSVGVTALAAIAGVGAAVASALLTAGMAPDQAARSETAQLVVLAAIVVQIPLYRFSGIYDEDEFGVKHILFVAFMTFSMWFVTWGIILQTGATF